MTNKRRILACILASLLCMSMAACGDAGEKETETTAAPVQTETVVEETIEEKLRPDLEIRDFDGKTFRILGSAPSGEEDWYIHEMVAEELTGDAMNDAVYNRNEFLTETFGYEIELVISSDWNPATEIKNLVSSADDTYDTFGVRAVTGSSLSTGGYYLDLSELPVLSLDEEWWSPSLCSPLTIGGHQYMATGDISVVPKEGVRAFYFNKELLVDHQLESPYELVNDGKWTYEKMFSMMETATVDLNGDGVMNGNDQWGMQAQGVVGMVLYQGSGEALIGKDEADMWVYSAGNENSVNAMMRISELMEANKNFIYLSEDWTNMLSRFEKGQGLFYSEVLLHIETMRGFEVDFGIIPTPKYDEAQEGYAHFLDSHCNIMYSLPVTQAAPEDAAYILETIAYASRTTITPAYYDICLKSKYSRDEESAAMLDIIFTSYRLELADVFAIGDIYSSVVSGLQKGNISSMLAGKETSVQTAIETVTEKFTEGNNW